jgi:hypothetical protein
MGATPNDDGGPAFATPTTFWANGWRHDGQKGMSLRDFFAAAALAGLAANPGASGIKGTQEGAKVAYEAADAMLAERRKGGAA